MNSCCLEVRQLRDCIFENWHSRNGAISRNLEICTVDILEVSCQWSVDTFDFPTLVKKVRVRYFQKISHISIREFNSEVVVTRGFDPSCRYNVVIQNSFAQFNL